MGQQRARDRNEPLSVAVAALLLFALVVATAAAKLDALRLSELAFNIEAPDPVCVSSGYCFGVSGSTFERTGSAYRLPLMITGVDNVYRLAKELDEGTLKPVVSGAAAGSVRIEPSYTLYINVDEAARQIGASLEFDRRPTGRISIAFERDGVASKPFTVDFRRNDIGRLGSVVAATEPKHVRAVLGILVLLIVAMTSVLDAGAADRSMLGGPAFAATPVRSPGGGRCRSRDRLADAAYTCGFGDPDAVAGHPEPMAGGQPLGHQQSTGGDRF